MENQEIKCYYMGRRQKNKQCRCTNLILVILIAVLLFTVGILVGAAFSATFLTNIAVMYLAIAILILMLVITFVYRVCACAFKE